MSSVHSSSCGPSTELVQPNTSHPHSKNQVNAKRNFLNEQHQHQQPTATTAATTTHANLSTKPSPSPANGPVRTSKKQQKPLTPEEIQQLLQSKIGQLDAEQHLEQEEEKEMAKAIKSASKEIHQLITEGGAGSDAIHQKYMDLFQDYKKLERNLAKLKRKYEQANKDKDSGKSELSKVTGQKQKIETLCRQLQQENKRIKEESKRLSHTEQAKREELTSKFETTIWEIKSKMEEDNEEKRRRFEDTELWVILHEYCCCGTLLVSYRFITSLSLTIYKTTNHRLKDKFATFIEQYEIRERHFQAVIKSRQLELQLAEVKLEQQKHLLQQEELKVDSMKAQLASFIKTEAELRQQLNTYVDKFKQVEDTLTKSNELFAKFRSEMQQMTKKTQKLEKEHATVQAKCDRSSRSLIEMAETVQKSQKSLESSVASKQKLENLCRALQVERNNLRARLFKYENPDESGIEHTKDSELTDIMYGGSNNTSTVSIPAAPNNHCNNDTSSSSSSGRTSPTTGRDEEKGDSGGGQNS
ncbi:hypothetical protein SeLEV6574_g05780 [Synchytrium endobioticum]|uniref:Alpha-taxilin n=1 Tax=Synchytrium endobioticum TaxID=286115 RepID=A0A507CSD8_9FUNG|nr:hypothetical protein SeLEV6574_g05780 [Synchytrium endobioticum]